MAQVIRKYENGGSTNLTWREAENPNIEFFGNSYTRKELSSQVFGKDYLLYKQQLNLSDEYNNKLDQVMHNYVDGLLSGRLVMHDDKITDSQGVYQNDGIIKKGKSLTEADIQNNLSIFAANYLVDRFNRKRPFKTSPKLDPYVFDIEKKLWDEDGSPGGFNIESFITLDMEKDPNTGLRSTKNRAKKLSEVLRKELRDLYLDIEYRNSFNWGGKDFELSLRYAKKTADTLGLLARGLSDGKVDEEDIGYIKSLGLDAPFEELLGIQTKESKEIERKKLEEEAKKLLKQQQLLEQALLKYGPGLSVQSPEYPWQKYKIYQDGSEISDWTSQDALNFIGEWKKSYSIENVNGNYYFDDLISLGYKYIASLNGALPSHNNIDDVILVQKEFNSDPVLLFYQSKPGKNNSSTGWRLASNPRIVNGELYVDYNGKTFTLGAFNSSNLTFQYLPKLFLLEIDFSNAINYEKSLLALANYASSILDNRLYGAIIRLIGNRIAKGNVTLNGKTIIKYTGLKNGLYSLQLSTPHELNGYVEFILTNGSNNIPKDKWGPKLIVSVKYVKKNKSGGILKAFNGMLIINANKQLGTDQLYNPVIYLTPPTIIDPENPQANQQKSLMPQVSFDLELNEYLEWLTGKEIETSDKVRLGGAVADVASAIAGFVPGLNVASAAVGAGSSLAEYGADLYDLLNGREGALGFLSATGELAMNLGMDAVSLIPAGKSAKLLKGLKIIANWAPHAIGIMNAFLIVSDPNLQQAFILSMRKVENGDFSKLTTLDLYNVSFALRSILGAKSLKHTFTPNKSTHSRVTGRVKNKNGEYVEVSATLPNDRITRFGSDKKAAKEAIANEANKNESIKKDTNENGEEIKFTTDDVELDTNWFGLKAQTLKIQSDDKYTPKKAFLGVFGSKGFNWAISDYALSKNPWFRNKVMNLQALEESAKKKETHKLKKEVERLSKMADERLEAIKDISSITYKDSSGNDVTINIPKKPKITGDSALDINNLNLFHNDLNLYVNNIVKYNAKPLLEASNRNSSEGAELPKNDAENNSSSESQKPENSNESGDESNSNSNESGDESNSNSNNDSESNSNNDSDNLNRVNNLEEEVVLNESREQNNLKPKSKKSRIILQRAKEYANRIYSRITLPSKENAEKSIILQYINNDKLKRKKYRTKSNNKKDKYINSQRDLALKWWDAQNEKFKTKNISKKIRKSLKIHNSLFQFMLGGLLCRNEIFLNLLNLYKSGGSLIRKLQEGDNIINDPINNIKSTTFYHKDDNGEAIPYESFDDIFHIVLLFYANDEGTPTKSYTAEDAKEWIYELKGKDNTKRRDVLDYYAGNDNNANTRDLTLKDSENLLRDYKGSEKFKLDVSNVYDTWKKDNTNKSIYDFIDEYNKDLENLYLYTLVKTSPQYSSENYGYNLEIGQNDDIIRTWNMLFKKLYPTLTKYDEGLAGIHGQSSVIRFPLYFDEADKLLFENINSRTVKLDGSNVYFDTKGFLHINPDLEYLPKAADTKQDRGNQDSNIYTAVNPKDEPSKFNPNYGLFGDIAGLFTSIAGNTSQLHTLKNLKPTFIDPTYKYEVVRGNVIPELEVLRLASSLNTLTRLPFTSNLSLLMASVINSLIKGNDLVNNLRDKNISTYDASLKADQDVRNNNLAQEVAASNANRKAATAMHNNWITTKNAINSANIKAFLDFLTSLTKEAKAIALNKLHALQKLLELNYKQALSNAQVLFEKDMMNTIKNDLAFMDSYRKRNNYGSDAYIPDNELKLAYLDMYPDLKDIWLQLWLAKEAELMLNYYKLTQGMFKYPWNMVIPGYTYDVTTGYKLDEHGNLTDIPIDKNKKGGTLTATDRKKLQTLKDFNKSLREDSKLFNKNMRESQKEFNKMLKELSKTSLTLLKTAMQVS